jgi:ribosome-binding protein aMBF1 (putative translation factor)
MPIRHKARKSDRNGIQPQRFNANAADTWDYVGQHTFASYLKAERARRGCSRHVLAVTTGIQEKRLVEIEMGKEMPSFKDIRAIATVLEVPESELMTAGHLKQE